MSTTYSNMGLKSWNSASDIFSYTELDTNWSKVDAHDHTSGKGLQIPAGGLANNAVTAASIASGVIDNSKISASAAIVGTKIASSTITNSNIVDGTIADVKLVSPILRGVVNSGGTIAQGTGFTVTKGATGAYTVNFSTAYAAAPIAFVGSSAGTEFISLVSASTTALTISLITRAGAATDAKFNFLVIKTS